MSNRIVPTIYRSIIDDVIQKIQVDFEEYGMEEELLQTLQAKWEAKLLETRVADFARPPPSPHSEEDYRRPHDPTSSSHMTSSHLSQMGQPYMYNNSASQSRQLPPNIPGPSSNRYTNPVYGATGPVYDINGIGNNNINNNNGGVKREPGLGDDVLRLRGGAPDEDVKPRIDKLGGISQPEKSSGNGTQPQPNAAGLLPGDDIIDSDLDDSDDGRDEGEGGDDEGEIDIVFCVYDKVQRVKNKWKTVFKDGMIHINGRDYLFAKCTGEFEW